MGRTTKGLVGCGLVLLLSEIEAGAQFHAKKADGKTGVNSAAVSSAARVGAASSGATVSGGTTVPHSTAVSGGTVNLPNFGGGVGGGDMILPEETRRAFAQNKVGLGQMQGKPIDIWGRAIYHSDESYTESKQDLETNTLTQVTKSKNGVRLQTRMVTLDENGRPSEVLIYDGREQFKYRGLQIYDTLGRFSEEQLYDAKGTLIRRKIQEYDPRGGKLPVRSVDYVANVPADLKLVITREDDGGAGGGPAKGRATAPLEGATEVAPKKGGGFRLFRKKE